MRAVSLGRRYELQITGPDALGGPCRMQAASTGPVPRSRPKWTAPGLPGQRIRFARAGDAKAAARATGLAETFVIVAALVNDAGFQACHGDP